VGFDQVVTAGAFGLQGLVCDASGGGLLGHVALQLPGTLGRCGGQLVSP
jgi:hypothetical protein